MDVFDLVRLLVGGPIAFVGLMLMFAGAIGALRLPDVYTRLHAVSISDGYGAIILVLGLAMIAPNADIALKLLLIAALLAAIGPAMNHLIASAAHGGGLAPVTRTTNPESNSR